MSLTKKTRAPLNRTINISDDEIKSYSGKLLKLNRKIDLTDISGKIINQDLFEVMDFLPDSFVDLLFLDPPYNLNKNFSSVNFKEMKDNDYEIWIDSWISKLVKNAKAKCFNLFLLRLEDFNSCVQCFEKIFYNP